MSRSRQRTPITGNCGASSEKIEKRKANRKLRRKSREIVKTQDESRPLPVMREASNVWTWGKDGKSYRGYCLNDPDFWGPLWKVFGK